MDKNIKKITFIGQSNTMPDGTINSTGHGCVIEWDNVTPEQKKGYDEYFKKWAKEMEDLNNKSNCS